MAPPLRSGLALAATLLAQSVFGSAVDAQDQAPPPVEHIDHVMIRSDRPNELYTFFTETLQLPVAWPMAERGGVTSGGVGFGNVNVEAIKFPGQTDRAAQTHLVGFAFKPSPLRQSLAELDQRGITYGEPRPFVSTSRDGARMTFFTNVTLHQFSDSDRPAEARVHVFLSEYNPAYVDVNERRTRLRAQLAARGGGPLGVRSVREVIIGTTDFATANRSWGRLLAPRRASAPGLWKVGDGPAIRLVPAGENMLQGLVISVGSLPQARAFLQEKGLLGSASATEVTIAPTMIHGLNIRLVQNGEPDA